MNARRVFLLLCVLFAGTATLPAQDADLEARLAAVAKAYKPEFPGEIPFDPSEWTTNEGFPLIGDPAAKKGGSFTGAIPEPLPSLRMEGPQSNLSTITDIGALLYEALVGIHPTTLEFVPGLATHWQIDLDKKILRYRLNPKARFSDGSEITADDVLASWEHVAGRYRNGVETEDESWSRKDPYVEDLYGKSFKRPVVEDKYTIRVEMTEENWRLPMYFGASMKIYPARYIRILGQDYIDAYQWKPVVGSGPYYMKPDDHVPQESYAFTRRTDYWGKDERWAQGLYNFDKVRYVVVLDDTLLYEKFKKGDLDYYWVNRASRWVQETDFDKVKMGWIQKRKVYTLEPQGFSGFCFNMRKPPFDDIRVRRAFALLFNREKLIEKLFFGEYEPLDSYYPGGIYENKENPKVRYDPRLAARLLEEAGWKERNADGILVKDGHPFELTLEYGSETWTRIFTPVVEDFRNAGIELKLELVDYNMLQKKVDERQFTIHYMSWTSLTFPNPESSWKSDLADKNDNNNLGGFKNELVDRLCSLYNKARTAERRIQIVQRIDKIIFEEYPYALGWYAPYERVMYWNRYGQPETYFTATQRPEYDIPQLWWYDPDKAAALDKAMKSNGELEVGETVQKPWEHLKDASASFGAEDGEKRDEGKNGKEKDGE
ncbi:MAG: ABC transporter substrate-binding protein [Planctomycetes bacterium]|nr:ABC transporter substrate-binding protein [Planctomycetota bacterium]